MLGKISKFHLSIGYVGLPENKGRPCSCTKPVPATYLRASSGFLFMSLASFIPTMNSSCALRPVVNISCTARSSPFSVRGSNSSHRAVSKLWQENSHHQTGRTTSPHPGKTWKNWHITHTNFKKIQDLTAVQQPVALDLHHYTKESRPGYHQNLAVPPANWIC